MVAARMVRIRLLTSIQGGGPVTGQPGDVLEVDATVARVWADGERAELAETPVPVRVSHGTI